MLYEVITVQERAFPTRHQEWQAGCLPGLHVCGVQARGIRRLIRRRYRHSGPHPRDWSWAEPVVVTAGPAGKAHRRSVAGFALHSGPQSGCRITSYNVCYTKLLREIKQNVAEIMTRLDHNFLNELDYFDDNNPPSSENIAVYIANSLQTMLKDPKVRVTSVTAWESENACATYLT